MKNQIPTLYFAAGYRGDHAEFARLIAGAECAETATADFERGKARAISEKGARKWTNHKAEDLRSGLAIRCNGYEGAIKELPPYTPQGMASVRIDSGSVCVAISELIRFQNFVAGDDK